MDLSGADLLLKGHLTAEAFALSVVLADGFEPDASRDWQDRIASAFVARYGASVVETSPTP